MHNNSISKLLELEDVIVCNVTKCNFSTKIFIKTKARPHQCPCCGKKTSRVHDYRSQSIKDSSAFGKPVILVLNKRRYVCSCGKRFYESYSFLPRYHRMTSRLISQLCSDMGKCIPISMAAKNAGVSSYTAARILDFIKYPKPSRLPEVLCMDEFKGNTDAGKYQSILVDGKTHKILDILPTRNQSHITSYFVAIPRYERLKVRFFVCDMCGYFAQAARNLFPNATIIVDRYHFVRQVTWAVENVRKRIQKSMLPHLRKYFKKSRSLILKHAELLSEHDKQALDVMLSYSDDLRQAYILKEKFYEVCHEINHSKQRLMFGNWILRAENTHIKEFNSCLTAFRNWTVEILNAFKYKYSNGPTEGKNNRIKVLKRVCFGVRKFERFRNRILHLE